MRRPGRSKLFTRRTTVAGRPSVRRTQLLFESLEMRCMLAADAGQVFTLFPNVGPPLPAIEGTAEIHGLKWSDTDGDGTRNDGEPGLAGVTIYIDANENGELEEGELSTVTVADNPATSDDETGQYEFTGLAAGTYIVREVLPTGYELTFPLAKESQFNIEIVFPDNTLSPEARAIFEEAAARWQELIIGDIPDVQLAGVGLVDDLRIEARGPSIDGPGGVLGQAGPTDFRNGSSLPINGIMEFDSADIANLLNDGQFDEVVLHEMGHVLGLGTIWQDLGLITGVGTNNARFTGDQATAEYNAIFGLTGTSVPVESDQGGAGTLYGHWDEDTLENELMTGFLNSGVDNPISRITVGQMADLGYEVDLDAADEYEAPALAALQAPGGRSLGGRLEILNLPRNYVDPLPVAASVQLGALTATPHEAFWTVELADGEIAENVDFGNMPLPGSIRGVKWNDRDGDGVKDASERLIENWTIFLDDDGDGEFDHDTQTIESEDVPVELPDVETSESILTVEGLPGAILDVNITFDITHTYDADLRAMLVSPSGRQITLFSHVGSSANNFTNTTLDDEALGSVTAGAAPFSGTFRPASPLSQFDGEDPNGEWTLIIVDDASIDVGSLNSWSLTIESGERSTTTNEEGAYEFLDLTPGDYDVAEVLLPDWVQTYPGGDFVHHITLAPGQDRIDVDFGNHSGFIGGRVWNDYDGDGVQDEGEPSLPGWTVFLDQNENGVLDDGPTTIASTNVPISVIDLGQIESHITVAELGAIQDVNVTLNLQHTYDSDLDVFLISPDGVRVELFTDVGTFGDDFTNTTLDDEAALSITAGEAPFTASFRPEGLLSAFDGADPNGVWTLEINDDTLVDVGVLLGWSLTIATNEPTAITDANGLYGFEDLKAGVYAVGELAPAGWVQTFPAAPGLHEITLARAETVANADFGNRAGSIRGVKWNDKNHDGVKDEGEPGLPGWIVYIDSNNNSSFDNGGSTTASIDPPQPIPDLGEIPSTLTVSGLLAIDDLNVQLSIAHTDVGDLDVFLISPAGTRVELFTDVGGGGANFDNTTLDDQAPASILAGAGPFAGSYRPEGLLSDFNGENPNGTWTLEVTDDAGNDVGTLKGWSLTITWHEPFATTDADGSYAFIDLPPGAYLVREVPQPNWSTTFPASPAGHALSLAAGNQLTGVGFGARPTPLLGDYDGNGVVDGLDFLLWARNHSATASPNGSGADGDGDGKVGPLDLDVWDETYGNTAAQVANSVTQSSANVQSANVEAAVEAAFAEIDAASLAGPLAYTAPARSHAAAARPTYRPGATPSTLRTANLAPTIVDASSRVAGGSRATDSSSTSPNADDADPLGLAGALADAAFGF